MTTLANVAKVANEEFVRTNGVRFFDVPLRQLFVHDAKGTLVVHPEAEANRRILARMALDFQCGAASGVSLRRSLKLGREGSSLLYATGARMLCAVSVDGAPRLVAFALVMNLKAAVVEAMVLRHMQTLPHKALYLELVCAMPHTGGATYLLLRLLAKLERTHTGILAHAVNAKSRTLLERHFYAPRGPGVYYLDRATAQRHTERYLGLLRTSQTTQELCTRHGVTAATRGKTYWDCR